MTNQNKKLFLAIFFLALTAGLAVSFSLVSGSWIKIIGVDNRQENRNSLNLSDSRNNNSGENDDDSITVAGDIQTNQLNATVNDDCRPAEVKLEEDPSNIIIYKDENKDEWLHVKNSKYGFEFSYPENFILEEREKFSESYYGAVFAYIFANPDFGKQIYECPTDEEIEMYGGIEGVVEEYGEVPALMINVYKAERDNSRWTLRREEILKELDALGVDRDAILATLSFMSGYGDYITDPVTKEEKTVDIDACSEILLDKIGGRYVIKQTGCRGGPPFQSEEAIFLEKDSYVITVYDFASNYSEYFEEILSTFQFN